MRLWDWKSKHMKASFQAHTSQIYTISVSAGGEFLATGAEDGSVKLWRVATMQAPAPSETAAVELATLSAQPDGNWLVVAPDGRFDTTPDRFLRGDTLDLFSGRASDPPSRSTLLASFIFQIFTALLEPRFLLPSAVDPFQPRSTASQPRVRMG